MFGSGDVRFKSTYAGRVARAWEGTIMRSVAIVTITLAIATGATFADFGATNGGPRGPFII